jgi:2'-5' RNA ligase
VEGDGTARLFFGLPLPPAVAEELARWARDAFAGSGARALPPESLHVTLAFLGRWPTSEVRALVDTLRAAAGGMERPLLAVSSYRETERVGMLVLDDTGGCATELQHRLSERLEVAGYRPERRPWLPHVTVARFRGRPRLRPVLPVVAPFSPSDAALYHSLLRPSGAQYVVLEAVALGG